MTTTCFIGMKGKCKFYLVGFRSLSSLSGLKTFTW